jgi:hypothetical protein
MADTLNRLMDGVRKWRERGPKDYWIHVGYLGDDLTRVGEHELTRVESELWHSKDGGNWRELLKGSTFWLFSVEGTFVWARDVLTKLLPARGADESSVELHINPEYGYVEYMRVQLAPRDQDNFTFEVKGFGEGAHPEW